MSLVDFLMSLALGLLATLVLAFVLRWFITTLLNTMPWSGRDKVRDILLALVWPMAALAVLTMAAGRLPGGMLTLWENPALTLDLEAVRAWLAGLVRVWFFYALVAAVVRVVLAPANAAFWVRRVVRPLFALLALAQAAGVLDDVLNYTIPLTSGQVLTVRGLVLATVSVAVVFIVARAIRAYMETSFLPKSGFDPAVSYAVSATLFYVVLIVGVLSVINALGFPLTTLTVIAGGLSVGLGFGLQAIFNNLASGFILMFERALAPGDVIVHNGDEVVVERIGIRSTLVRTRGNVLMRIPNADLLNSPLANYGQGEEAVRVGVGVGVSYDADPREVERLLLQAADHPLVLETPAPQVAFVGFGDNSLDFELRVWTNQPQRIPVLKSELRYRIFDVLSQHGVEIPYPQRDVHLRSGWERLGNAPDA